MTKRKIAIIGLGKISWDDQKEQMESLLNPHVIHEYGLLLDEHAKTHGGLQCLRVADHEIPLDFDGNTTMWINHQPPT